MTTTTETKRFTLDGEPVDLAEFLSDNRETFTVAEAEAIAAMAPGAQMLLGGGAGADFLLRCESAAA
jgi:hypothetical protein